MELILCYRIVIAPNIHTGKKVVLAFLGSTAFVGVVWTGMIAAAQPPQATALRPSFEVSSIRANHSGGIMNRFHVGRGGAFNANNCSLALLIRYAYNVFEFQISGGPGWVRSDGYDVAAKAQGDPQEPEIRTMLQRLIEDRFQFKYHWETREGAVYRLVMSKAGKLNKSSDPRPCPSILDIPFGPSSDAPCGDLRTISGHTDGRQVTAGDLANHLSFFLGRVVVDKTGLSGKYDIDVRWTPERLLMQSPPPGGVPPSIFTALQEQLGLKLESAKGPVKTLVVDHVARPSDN